jgi:hypothetical protein
MTDWLRLWHDMPTDPKWRVIARKSGQPLACVIAVFNLVLVNASANAADRGSLAGWDDEDAAAALDMDAEAVTAIMQAMQGKVLDGARLSGWERRQPKREDATAAARKQAWKERNAPPLNDAERSGTHGNAAERPREEESREDVSLPTVEKQSSLRSDRAERAPSPAPKLKSEDAGKRRLLALGVPEDLLADFLKVRKAHNAPLTDNAVLGMIREFESAGITETEGIRLCVERNWRGFRAEFLRDKPPALRIVGNGPRH